MNKWIVQIGHSRDGLRNYARPAEARGLSLCIIDTPIGDASCRRADLIGEPAVDQVVRTADNGHETLIAAVQEFARTHEVVQVLPGFELYTHTTGITRERLDLPGPRAADIEPFRYKSVQRQCLEGTDVLQPRYAICTNLTEAQHAAENIGFPVIVKQEDGGGSQGVWKVHHLKELQQAVEQMSLIVKDDGQTASGRFLVEEFISGAEFGVSGVVDVDGQVTVLAVTERTIYRGNQDQMCMILCDIAYPTHCVPQPIAALATAVITNLGLRSSPFDMDVRLPIPDQVVLIEAGARITGGGVPRCLSHIGIDLAAFALDAALGLPVPSPNAQKANFCGQQYLTVTGELGAYSISLPAWDTRNGEWVEMLLYTQNRRSADADGSEYAHISDRIGVIRAIAASPTRVHEILDQVLQHTSQRILPHNE